MDERGRAGSGGQAAGHLLKADPRNHRLSGRWGTPVEAAFIHNSVNHQLEQYS